MTLTRLEVLMTRVSRVIALIGLAGLIVLCFATIADVLMRWLFDAPITGVRDTYALFLGVIIASCFPLCKAERSNITIRFLGNALGNPWRKAFELFGGLFTILIFSVIAWKTWDYANNLKLNNETTWMLGWPVAPWWRIIVGLIAFSVLVLIVVFLRDLKAFQSNEDDSPKGNGAK